MDEKPDKSLVDAVQDGDQLEMFESLRRQIADQIVSTESGRDMAALSKQFVEITEKIESIKKNRPDKERRTSIDEIRNRRQKKTPSSRKPNAKN